MSNTTLLAIASVLACSALACSTEQPARTPEPASAAPNNDSVAPGGVGQSPNLGGDVPMNPHPVSAKPTTTTVSSPTQVTPVPPPAADVQALSDGQILQVTHVANQGEIEQAKLAKSKAKDPRVKQLAEMMIKDHSDADAKAMAIAKSTGLTPAANEMSVSLQSDADATSTSLKMLTGQDFDKAYVDAQVREHRAVLDAIDQKLIPAAQNADVKAFLAAVRPKIAMHLSHAEDLQKQMAK